MTRPLYTGPAKTRTAGFTAVVLAISLSAAAQTPIQLDDNKFSPQEDVEIGREAAAQVRRELPMLNDRRVEGFIEDIGERLVSEIPPQFRQPAFRYSFDVVNLREINAFALPGGPMFLHRGIIEAAATEGEIAGVMAHELSHVVLRHGTAQATKGQKFQIGALAGQVLGAIIGGTAGSVIAQGSQFGLGAYFLKYSREYEREADLLGAQIMARAGYDPRQMANMFRTIERQGGARGPEWLSSHPNPGNRYEAINREAAALQIDGRAGSPSEFRTVKARLQQMAPAPTMEQVARQQESRRRPVATSGRGVVEPPSSQWRTYRPGDFLTVAVPANWHQIGGRGGVQYVPEGGYFQGRNGGSAFTHGVQIGVVSAPGERLEEATAGLIEAFAAANPQLRRSTGYSRTTIDGRRGMATTLTNVSEVTGQSEVISLATVPLQDGSLLYLLGVAPQDEARGYQRTFDRVRASLRIEDRVRRR